MTTLAASPDTLIERRVIPLADLVLDPGLQPREGLDEETIERYASAMAAGVQLPDIVVYYDGTTYRLADGWHRHAAATRLQRVTISAEIHRGTQQEALLYALRANTEHGLQRRPGDLRRAVELALNNPTIARESDRRIAELCRCSHTYVSQVRKALSGNSCQIDDEETRIVRRGEQVYEQRVGEPEPTEADIVIARDLIPKALLAWTKPVSVGRLHSQVQKLEGGAGVTGKAVKAALYRMIEAGNVLEVKDAYNRTAYALAHDPAVQIEQPAPSDEKPEKATTVIDELNAKFDRSAITILGRTDDGAEHRAVDIARKLVAAGVWDGQTKIEFDAYALHDRLYGVERADPRDLISGQDFAIIGRPANKLKQRILDLLANGPLELAQIRARLGIELGDHDGVKVLHEALAELVTDKRLRQVRDLYLPPGPNTRATPGAEPEPRPTADEIDAANGFTEASALPYGGMPAPAWPPRYPTDFNARILELLAASPLPVEILCERLGMTGPAQRSEVQATLGILLSEGKAQEHRGMWSLASASPSAEDDRGYKPQTMEDLLDRPVVKPNPDEQQLQTPTAKNAEKVLALLKQHAPMPLRMKYIREQLDMGDSEFYRARMLLMGAGEVAQDGESLRLVVKAAPQPASAPVPPAALIDMDVHYSSKTDEWHTPADLLERVITVLTGIDLDPCSNSHEAPNVPAAMHYTKEDDGLAQEWTGKVFMNSPYGRTIPQWIDKLVSEYRAGRVTQAIALVPARTDTAWFAALRDFPRCFLQGRLTFRKSDGSDADPAPFPSALVYLGPDIDRFAEVFSDLGDIYVRYTPKEEGGVSV